MYKKIVIQDVIKAVTEVSDFITREAQAFDANKVMIKELNSLVSYVDQQAELMLIEKLTPLVPNAGFLAEEGQGIQNAEGYNWIIDPLDGTTNFVHGVPVFAISVGLAHNKDLILGVVYEVCRKECFWAISGQGAFLWDKPIKTSRNNTLSNALLATGFPYQKFEHEGAFWNTFSELMKNCRGLRRLGSAAVDLAYTACGRFDGFFEYRLNAWDVAAGALLVKEAGGLVTDYTGKENYLFGGEILAACNPDIHKAMLNSIQKYYL
ncbi:MAG: inositol monophosphatase [Cytophagales bacterium]|nr:MAG: inositol monophosphatase [Cytophagales bacterium]TAF60012.1 MAG: inositol monophosphatase [Cytophagales bacterium]